MAYVFSYLIRLTSPLWRFIGAHPWLSTGVSAALAPRSEAEPARRAPEPNWGAASAA